MYGEKYLSSDLKFNLDKRHFDANTPLLVEAERLVTLSDLDVTIEDIQEMEAVADLPLNKLVGLRSERLYRCWQYLGFTNGAFAQKNLESFDFLLKNDMIKTKEELYYNRLTSTMIKECFQKNLLCAYDWILKRNVGFNFMLSCKYSTYMTNPKFKEILFLTLNKDKNLSSVSIYIQNIINKLNKEIEATSVDDIYVLEQIPIISKMIILIYELIDCTKQDIKISVEPPKTCSLFIIPFRFLINNRPTVNYLLSKKDIHYTFIVDEINHLKIDAYVILDIFRDVKDEEIKQYIFDNCILHRIGKNFKDIPKPQIVDDIELLAYYHQQIEKNDVNAYKQYYVNCITKQNTLNSILLHVLGKKVNLDEVIANIRDSSDILASALCCIKYGANIESLNKSLTVQGANITYYSILKKMLEK
jgi:hypothetical protein